MTDLKVSFLGLGVMGYPMAGHLVNAGLNVTVYNRTFKKHKIGLTNTTDVLSARLKKLQRVLILF